jgi:uncharacterized protein YceK
MKPNIFKFVSISTYVGVILSGCASLSTEIVCSSKNEKISNNENTWTGSVCSTNTVKNKYSVDDGIVYYMPKRDIKINVQIASVKDQIGKPLDPIKDKNNKITETNKTVTLTVTSDSPTTPDYDHIFLLRYNKNYIADNNMAIGVNSLGLLTITHADTINRVADIAANVATDIAIANGLPVTPTDSSSRSALKTKEGINIGTVSLGNNSVVFPLPSYENCPVSQFTLTLTKDKKDLNVCGAVIKLTSPKKPPLHDSFRISPAGFLDHLHNLGTHVLNYADVTHFHTKSFDNYPGIFYRQNLPYTVSIKVPGLPDIATPAEFTALSPNESPIYFAPIIPTVFSDNTNDISLENGIVTILEENTSSELNALTQIPAKILKPLTNSK